MSADPLATRARTSPRGLALVDQGEPATRLTWGQLDAMAGVWAHRLGTAGIVRGDLVAVAEPAGARFAALLHACIRIGAVIAPLPPRAHEAEKQRLMAQAGARALITRDAVEMRDAATRYEGDLCVMHTSGTSGPSKPVRQTLANHRASARGCLESVGRRRGDSWLLMLSPHHVGGFAIFMRSVLHGQPVVSLPAFDAGAVIAALEQERPTLVSAVPSMLTRIIDAGGTQALARPRAIIVGGAPATDDEVREWVRVGLNVCPSYGMTETCSQVATVPPGRALELLGTAGFVHSEANVEIDGDGLISVSGAVVSPSFGGTVQTGDVGHFDQRGALVVVGRNDDVIITGGEKVHPTEVEDVLRGHPGVRDVAVVGRADRVYGQVLEALVVGAGVGADELVAWSRERLPSFKVPRRVRFVDRLPRSQGGKLRRREL